MEIDPQRPTLFLRAVNLWSGTVVVVFGVNAPRPGEARPHYSVLCELSPDELSTCALPTRASGARFRHAAIAFAVTARRKNIGTVIVEVRRDEDTPVMPPFDRPLYKSIELKRKSIESPPFMERIFPLTIKAPT